MPAGPPTLYTIGHSNHPIEAFVGLLAEHRIDAVADVRSVPYSRRHPQFRRDDLARSLGAADVRYVFLGDELGARTRDPACLRDGRVDYELVAQTERFARGLARVLDGAARYRIALLCAEREPLDCHRTLLVARRLAERGARVRHVLADGDLEEHTETERRLLTATGRGGAPLYPEAAREELAEAYRLRAQRLLERATRRR